MCYSGRGSFVCLNYDLYLCCTTSFEIFDWARASMSALRLTQSRAFVHASVGGVGRQPSNMSNTVAQHASTVGHIILVGSG